MADIEVKTPVEQLAAHLALSADQLAPLFATADESLLALVAERVTACESRFSEARDAFELEKAARSQLAISRDRQLNQQEVKLKTLNTQLAQLRTELAEARSQRAAVETELEQLRAQSGGRTEDTQRVQEELSEARRRISKLEADLEDANMLLGRRKKDADTAAEEHRELLAEQSKMRAEARELRTELEQARTAERASNMCKQHAEQELALARQNTEWLTQEMSAKSTELQRLRQERAEQTAGLQTALESAQGEAAAAQRKAVALERRLEGCTLKLEEALERQRDLERQQAETDAAFKAEMEAQKRMCELWESGQREAKERVEHLEGLMAEAHVTVEHAEERCRLAEEQEAETRRELGSQREALETEVEKLRTELNAANELLGDRQQWQRDVQANGLLSPTAAAVTRMQKSGKSFTEIYADYVRVQDELVVERQEKERLTESLTQILQEIEERAPQLQRQREEYESICGEATQLADQLTAAMKDREELARQTDEARLHRERVDRENVALKKESERLALQIQTLLNELQGNGTGSSATAGDVVPSGVSDVEHVISTQLTAFRSIQELQQQNQRLLRITQDLAERLEREEETRRRQMADMESEAITQAEQLIQELRSRLQTAHLRIDSYVRERDLLRRMLANAGQHIPGLVAEDAAAVHDGLAHHEAPRTPEPQLGGAEYALDTLPLGASDAALDRTTAATVAESVVSAAETQPEVTSMLRELQEHFDAYRKESGADLHTLREQLGDAQRQCTQYRVDIAQANAQITYLNERYQLLVQNTELQKDELQALRERNAVLQEQAGRQELATSKMTDQLLTAREEQEELRQQCANLRAEKNLFHSMQERMMNENATLSQERSNLNDVMRNLEQMQREVDRTSSEARVRFENQIQGLERDLETVKAKLNEEAEAHRTLLLRKELEAKDYQAHIDKLVSESGPDEA
ncbi:hypothetical protein THASP1DRAFT_32796 [Thamnocephalis sphaerospora]|uniref:Nucleoprotein TPR/MLP1 domain-containing protein n=1 Tax=Thamnocephalis sphaerospora TaxID=78915 RepID=A0A4P9XI60_9FUNG|nr:hypothetical protein THASP1DRAFT_32796 [Thamnocephalis sphaerospora]|eukprot:RKP05362.1 hypothetical protein THASP1DRAFT_32796 [Thamnocephalis sphaerospora]